MLAVLVAAADGAADSTTVPDGPIKYSTDLKVQTTGETPTTKLYNSYLLWVDGDKLFIDFALETADAEYDTTVQHRHPVHQSQRVRGRQQLRRAQSASVHL